MSTQINNSRGFAARTVLAAAAAAVALAATASVSQAVVAVPGVTAGVNNVTGINTRLLTGTQTTVNNVAGASMPTGGANPFPTSNKYNLIYSGNTERVLSVSTGSSTYNATGFADNIVRRFVGPNNDLLWYRGNQTGFTNGSTINLNGPALGGFSQAFAGNAINVGADNLFSTSADGNTNRLGNYTNVDRVDLLFNSGVTATTNSVFMISDRGDGTDHDAFAVAGITSLDANGDPASYGPLLRFNHSTWGTTNVVGNSEAIVLRKNNNDPSAGFRPSDFVNQGVGGVAVTTAALAGNTGAGSIFGYSLFSPMLTVTGDGSGTQLVDYTNLGVYGYADGSTTGGGIDPTATIAVLYTRPATSVPEPTTAALATAATGLLLSRRRKGASRRGA